MLLCNRDSFSAKGHLLYLFVRARLAALLKYIYERFHSRSMTTVYFTDLLIEVKSWKTSKANRFNFASPGAQSRFHTPGQDAGGFARSWKCRIHDDSPLGRRSASHWHPWRKAPKLATAGPSTVNAGKSRPPRRQWRRRVTVKGPPGHWTPQQATIVRAHSSGKVQADLLKKALCRSW